MKKSYDVSLLLYNGSQLKSLFDIPHIYAHVDILTRTTYIRFTPCQYIPIRNLFEIPIRQLIMTHTIYSNLKKEDPELISCVFGNVISIIPARIDCLGQNVINVYMKFESTREIHKNTKIFNTCSVDMYHSQIVERYILQSG